MIATFETAQFDVRVVAANGRGGPIVDPDVRDAQRLRYVVFADELGANLKKTDTGIDEDEYDAWCDHLIVRDRPTGQVVGTYRMVPPATARRLGYYSDTEFCTTRLDRIKPDLLEFGRSCIHRDYRNGPVIMLLWAALARYMVDGGYEYVIGCASVSMRDGGHEAASLFRRLKDDHAAGPEHHVVPRLPLPLDRLDSTLAVETPPLIKGYLRAGARICGDPAWDPEFNTADFFLLLSRARINPRYAKHFGTMAASSSFDERRAA